MDFSFCPLLYYSTYLLTFSTSTSSSASSFCVLSSSFLSFHLQQSSTMMISRTMSVSFFLCVFLLSQLDWAYAAPSSAEGKIDCLIDSQKGFSNPANVYQCQAGQKCCEEFAKPSCCGSKPTTLIM